jgi:hypothetical protein
MDSICFKKCRYCREKKTIDRFDVARVGHRATCKECLKIRDEKKAMRKNNYLPLKTQPNEQSETVKKMIAYYLEYPQASIAEVSEATGIPKTTISTYRCTNAYFKSLRKVASGHITNLIPRALKSLEESLTSQNADVKFKSGVKVLENEKVLIKDGAEIYVNDLRSLPIERLKEIALQAEKIPQQTILEAELA